MRITKEPPDPTKLYRVIGSKSFWGYGKEHDWFFWTYFGGWAVFSLLIVFVLFGGFIMSIVNGGI